MTLTRMARNTLFLAALGRGMQWLYIHRPDVVESTLERLMPARMKGLAPRERMSRPDRAEAPLEYSRSEDRKRQPTRRKSALGARTGLAILLPTLLLGGWLVQRRRSPA